MKHKFTFIAWIAHNRRSQLLAQKFDMRLHMIQSLKRIYFLSPLRYLLQSARTIRALMQDRPDVVFVQNPPIFAVLVVYLYCVLSGAKYIIDSHTGALLAPWWQWTMPIHAFLSRRALTTLVTNEYLSAIVEKWDADAFIIADIPTEFPAGTEFPLEDKFSVAVINTFSPDEPIGEVLNAAAMLPNVNFYITGDPIRAKKEFLVEPPENVQFTGFLPDDQYFGLLRGVGAIIVLTTDNHTMQRGACEAVSMGQPIITSDWPILREYFHKGTIHVDNSAKGIREGIVEMQQSLTYHQQEILLLQQERREEWREKEQALKQLIEDARHSGSAERSPLNVSLSKGE